MKSLVILACAFVALLSGQSLGSAADRVIPANQFASITTKSDVHRTRVKTSGTIVWLNPYWHSLVIVDQADATGVLVELSNKHESEGLEIGSHVTIEGEVVVWEGHASLKAGTVEEIGPSEMPTPKALARTISQRDIFDLDCQLVSVEGRISFVMQHFERYVFWIDGYGVPIRAEFYEQPKETVGLDLAGATVRITGVAMQRGEGPSKRAVLMLNPTSADDIEVLERGPTWPSDGTGAGVNGVIVCQTSENRYFFRSDSREILELEVYDTQFLSVGDMVRYVGKDVIGPDHRKVSVTGMHVHATANDWVLTPLSRAQPVTSHSASGDYCTVLGSMSRINDEGEFFELIDDSGQRIRIEISMLSGDIATLQLPTAKKVEVAGYVDYRSVGTVVIPRSFRDIKVVERSPWYANPRARVTTVSTLVLLTLCIGSIFFLRGAIRAKTRALEESAGLLNASYEAVREGVCVIDRNDVFLMGNGRFFEMLGLSPHALKGMPADQLYFALSSQLDAKGKDLFKQLWNDDFPRGSSPEVSVGVSDGSQRELTVYSVRDTDALGANIGRVLVFHDSTERRQLEKSLAQAQKMDAVGTLAAGVAHDFNNSLSAIVNFAEVAKRSIDPEDDLYEIVSHILDAANQAAGTTRGLLTFCGKRTSEKSIVDLAELLGSFVAFVERLLPAKISITIDSPPDQPIMCRVDESQLQQAMLNLVVNSRDAMPDGGEICIKLLPDPIDRQVLVKVIDNGQGMDPGTREQAFDPFFSTKERGKGTGLGMAIVHGIVTDHGGNVGVASELDEGTTVTIMLPMVGGSPSSSDTSFTKMNAIAGNTFLVVEDQKPVLASIAQQLRSNDLHVVECGSAEEAMQIITDNASQISFALVDVDLPGSSGIEFKERARQIAPGLPVVLMSGLPRYQEADNAAFLAKPFGLEKLAKAVNAATQFVLENEPQPKASIR